MSGDSVLWKFLSKWLALRREDAHVKGVVLGLQQGLVALVRDDMPRKFREGLIGRVSDLKSLLAEIDRDQETPAPTPGSSRGRWLREARRLVNLWDESNWDSPAHDLSAEKNSLMLAAVSQSLEESIEKGQVNRDLAENLRSLRSMDEREFRALPLPPGPRAPWDPASYIFPATGGRVASLVQLAMTDCPSSESAYPVKPSPNEALLRAFSLIEEGWPVLRARVEGPLRQLADLFPVDSDAAVAFREALSLIDPGNDRSNSPTAPPDSGTSTTVDVVLAQARERLTKLAHDLNKPESGATAQAFGHRLNELVGRTGSATSQGLHQELAGCLASLDGPVDTAIENRWRLSALRLIAGICQDLGGGEILDEQLVGRPLGRWTEFVTVVSNDNEPMAGEPRRITRVERPGYCVIFSDGERRALVRARVQTSG